MIHILTATCPGMFSRSPNPRDNAVGDPAAVANRNNVQSSSVHLHMVLYLWYLFLFSHLPSPGDPSSTSHRG